MVSVELDEAQKALSNGDLREAQRRCIRAGLELGVMIRNDDGWRGGAA
jgi:hypothetical protein